jgi:hypothetical protein
MEQQVSEALGIDLSQFLKKEALESFKVEMKTFMSDLKA